MECRKYISSFKNVCIYLSLSLCVFRYFNEAVKTPVLSLGGQFYTCLFFIKLLHTNSNVNGALGVPCKEFLHVDAWLTMIPTPKWVS